VYSNATEVELFLNGESLGAQKTRSVPIVLPVGSNVSETHRFSSKYRLLWQVPYRPGVLLAVARTGGHEVARDEMHTAGRAARVRLVADRSTIDADGDDLSFITARVEDANGNLVPGADSLITFKVAGAGSIEAVDNGNAATVEAFHADHRHAFNGLALLIVRSRAGQAGAIQVRAVSAGLAQGAATITAATRP
jgi:beta-galactosidase